MAVFHRHPYEEGGSIEMLIHHTEILESFEIEPVFASTFRCELEVDEPRLRLRHSLTSLFLK